MQSLILLIKQYRILLLFIALELVSIWMIVRNNYYQNATFFNSANYYTGVLLSWRQGVEDYFSLSYTNEELARENARLRALLSRERQRNRTLGPENNPDSLVLNKYNYIAAEVVNNSTYQPRNYITLNKGRLDGIEPDMGVISSQGIVGKVSACSDHFSTVISLLHANMSASAQIKKNNELGSVRWDGRSPRFAKMLEISSHLNIKPGDTIVTSGYNATFPPKTPVGVVERVRKKAEETFYDIDVRLSTNFNRLSYVYVVKNILKVEQDSLEAETFEEIDE
ncbi:MAG: rod shape-determining protein MreC [Bacteroidia bacterium]|nr:rod shape-determining protein MreC [Bacteroidia bacterium]